MATGWSPKWRATVDGQPAPLTRSPDGLLALTLPAGPSTITLGFRPDRWDDLGAAATLLTLAVLAARRGRAASRTGRDAVAGPPGD